MLQTSLEAGENLACRSHLYSSGLFWAHWLAYVQWGCNWRWLHQLGGVHSVSDPLRQQVHWWRHCFQDHHCTPQPEAVDDCRLLRPRDSVFRTGDKAALRTARANMSWAIRAAKHAYAQRIHGHFQDSGDACGRAYRPSQTTRQDHLPGTGMPLFQIRWTTSTHGLRCRSTR